MFSSIVELTNYYCSLYGFSYEFLETLPKYMFVRQNREIFKRYLRDYKELLKFERAEKRAIKRYWYFKEKNNVEKVMYWLTKIKFLRDKRKKLVNKPLKLQGLINKKNDEEEQGG